MRPEEEEALRTSDVFLVILSHASLKVKPGESESKVLRQVRLARRLGKPLVVLRRDGIPIPSWLEGAPVVEVESGCSPEAVANEVEDGLQTGRIVPVVLPPLSE